MSSYLNSPGSVDGTRLPAPQELMMAKRGKNYRQASSKVDRDKLFDPNEALTLVKSLSSKVRRNRRRCSKPWC